MVMMFLRSSPNLVDDPLKELLKALKRLHLDQLDERVQGFSTKGVSPIITHQGIGLVDEENPTEGGFHDGLGLQSRLAAVTCRRTSNQCNINDAT